MFRAPETFLRPTPLTVALACAFATTVIALAPTTTVGAAGTGSSSKAYALRIATRHARAARRPAHADRTPSVPHDTLPVTSCLDDDGAGTLRSVVAGAAEGDIIDLSALTCSTITLTEGPINTSVADGTNMLYDLTLQGPGRDALTIDGAGTQMVLLVGGFSSDQGTFTVNDLTIANGTYSGGLGACITGFGGAVVLNRVAVTHCHSSGTVPIVLGGAVDATTLVMTDSTITGSSIVATGTHGTAIGGGAYASDSATLVRSTISGNTVTAPYAAYSGYTSAGGGLYSRGDLSLTDSTISGNSIETTHAGEDADGGGIYVRGIATISGSTIDGNSADGDGGGIFKAIYSVYGEPGGSNPTTHLTATNSTFADNHATNGGGIASSRPVELDNSTVASNDASVQGGGVFFRIAGITDSAGSLVLQSSMAATNSTSTIGAVGDLVGDDTVVVTGANSLVMSVAPSIVLPTDTLDSDPLLLPLANNGGLTRTLALGAGSPAIDAGNNVQELANDQRGAAFARVGGAAADIGAFEVQQPTPSTDVIFADGFDGEPTTPATYTYSYDDGDGDTNQGPPSTFDPDMLWGNYYMAQPGGQFVTHLSVAFGPTFPSLSNGPVTFWLLQDDDADDDPTNAHVIGSVQATPDVFNDNFYEVEISPTYVHGGFFVGASAKLLGGQDRPARVDTNASGHDSWFFYAPDIGATINNLASAPFGTRNDNPAYVVLPGAFMVRAAGVDELP